MEYRVIKHFTDLQDDGHSYNVGDIYPREGLTPTRERIAKLAGKENRQRVPLIAPITPETHDSDKPAQLIQAVQDPPTNEGEHTKRTRKTKNK